ncbi:hypothetical protein ABZV91_15510 [Nocardia sp. NPDC004568]|uniref:hypothetical protein n=1 Tax=Nocardia sp. NPDC004568 TaxID=3154551 RepID=UPI0033A2B13F
MAANAFRTGLRRTPRPSPVRAFEAIFVGAATAFYAPALATVLPQAVAGPELTRANALITLVTDTSVLIGPAAAAALPAVWPWPPWPGRWWSSPVPRDAAGARHSPTWPPLSFSSRPS